jgi:hypothetical protein
MNTGTLDELTEMVRRAWEWMQRLRVAPESPERAGGND